MNLGEHCEPARKTIQLKWWLCLLVLELAATSTKLSHFQQDIVLCIFVCFVKPVSQATLYKERKRKRKSSYVGYVTGLMQA